MIQSLPEGYTARHATTEDAQRVADLFNDRWEATTGTRPSTPEGVLRNWKHPKFNLSTDSRLVFGPDAELIGYAHLRDVKDPPVDVFSGYCVRPDHDESPWLWDDLFEWLEAEARRAIPKAPADARIVLLAGASDDDPTEQRELERYGFEHSRTFHRMKTEFSSEGTVPEPPRLPNGIGIREFIPGQDDEALVRTWCEAFKDHYGILIQPFETELEEWRGLMKEEGFDSSLWSVAHDTGDGTMVGLCVCTTLPPGGIPERAQVADLGVRPAWRRQGIGRSLLLHTFGILAERGIESVELTVDTENKSGAPTLYKQVGMHSIRVNHTYLKELRPGINLVAQ